MFKNVATKLAIFAFDITTGAPKTGDAGNLTAYVSKDYGTVTVLADTSATEMDSTNAKGWYLFDLAQGETNADALLFTGKSSTANISLVGQLVFTTPNLFTTLLIDANGRLDVIKIAGTTQTARDLGTSVLLSSGTGTGQVSLSSGLVSLSGTQTFNVTGNITGNLSGSVGSVTGAVGSVTGAVGSVTGAVGSVTGNVGGNVVGSVASVTDVNSIADGLLDRNMATGTDSGGRTVRNALRILRNKFSTSGTTLTVTKEDDITTAWTSTLTTDAAAVPITGSDPA